ncbi:hypothetical protein SAMN05444722_1058 [Rhodovulum sp. ES.010]|uniref:hypothetical protein n=1 Tax=Rhodovulum sp. ES.010 TaxID=1882821 RepID=UPI000928264F|nr:hypothetical protein [Rhodovulum sp. ES.010]SIO25838.1 hypothetical protein SAMN05444722_1058 [Rhodovulum sp. ES.010]
MNDINEKLSEIEDRNERLTNALKVTWTWLACIVLYLALTFFLPLSSSDPNVPEPDWLAFFTNTTIKGVLVEARTAVAGALATFVLLGVILDVALRSNTTSQIEAGLTRIILGNKRLLDSFSDIVKELFVRNSLRSTLGDETGSAVFSSVVHPLMETGNRFRRNYNYDIVLLDETEFPSQRALGEFADIFDIRKYRWVEENIGYESFDPRSEYVHRGPFTILMLFDKGTLPAAFERHDIYFRSMVELDADTRERFFTKGDEAIKQFVLDVMNFRALESIGRTELPVSIEIEREGAVDTSGRKHPVIALTVDRIKDVAKNKLVVKHRYPHHREVTDVTITLPQPSQGASFSVLGSSDVRRLEPI